MNDNIILIVDAKIQARNDNICATFYHSSTKFQTTTTIATTSITKKKIRKKNERGMELNRRHAIIIKRGEMRT